MERAGASAVILANALTDKFSINGLEKAMLFSEVGVTIGTETFGTCLNQFGSPCSKSKEDSPHGLSAASVCITSWYQASFRTERPDRSPGINMYNA